MKEHSPNLPAVFDGLRKAGLPDHRILNLLILWAGLDDRLAVEDDVSMHGMT